MPKMQWRRAAIAQRVVYCSTPWSMAMKTSCTYSCPPCGNSGRFQKDDHNDPRSTIFSILTVASALNTLFTQELHKKSAPRPNADADKVLMGGGSRPRQMRRRRLSEGSALFLSRASKRRPTLRDPSQEPHAEHRQEDRRARQQAAGRSAHPETDRELQRPTSDSERRADSRGRPACLNLPRNTTRGNMKAEGLLASIFSSAS
jgi:hypothetical protein